MSDELADMWKSDKLINNEVIDQLSPEVIKQLSEILNKLKQLGGRPRSRLPTKKLRKLCENPQQKYAIWA